MNDFLFAVLLFVLGAPITLIAWAVALRFALETITGSSVEDVEIDVDGQ